MSGRTLRRSGRRTDVGVDPRSVAETVVDPELPVLTLADLGVLRDVRTEDDGTPEPNLGAPDQAEHGTQELWAAGSRGDHEREVDDDLARR